MTTLRHIATSSQPEFDVVFVHGLDGDPDRTWRRGRHGPFWPDWLAEDHPTARVLSLGYDASSSAWRGHGLPLIDRATNVIATLLADDVGRRPVLFITHSLGGLLVKQLLRTVKDSRTDHWRCLSSQTVGIVFLSTPHYGSEVASWAHYLKYLYRSTPTSLELRYGSSQLRDLNNWFRDNVKELGIEVLSLFETRKTRCVRVIGPTNEVGLPNERPIPVDENHVRICKPRSRDDDAYKFVRSFVQRATSGGATEPPAATRSERIRMEFAVFGSLSESKRPMFQSDLERWMRTRIQDDAQWESGSLRITMNVTPEDANRILLSARTGLLDSMALIKVALLDENGQERGRSRIVRAAIKPRKPPPQSQVRREHLAPQSLWCPLAEIEGYEKFHKAATALLPDPTENMSEAVVYVTKTVDQSRDRRPLGESVYLQTNFLMEGALYPVKILDSTSWNLLELLEFLLYEPPPFPFERLVRAQRHGGASAKSNQLKKLHRNSVRYIVSRRLMNEDGSSDLDFAGARRWTVVAGEE